MNNGYGNNRGGRGDYMGNRNGRDNGQMQQMGGYQFQGNIPVGAVYQTNQMNPGQQQAQQQQQQVQYYAMAPQAQAIQTSEGMMIYNTPQGQPGSYQ